MVVCGILFGGKYTEKNVLSESKNKLIENV